MFIVGTVIIILLPGPNSLYVLSVAARSGLRMGYAGAFGIFTGDAVLMLATALGAASVLQTHPALFFALRWAGALYLGYLGLRLLYAAWHSWRNPRQSGLPQRLDADHLERFKPLAELTASAVYRKALLISLLNPKAILFFLSFFVQFVDPDAAHPVASFLLLALIVQIASASYLTALIWAGVRMARLFAQRRRLSAALNGVVGALFIAFGARLAS